MTYMPGPADYAIVALLLGAMTYELIFPKLKRRMIAYVGNITILWLLSGGVIALWLNTNRSWALLFLGPVVWWRLAIGVALFAAFLYLGLRDMRAARKNPKALERFLPKLEPMKWMMPVTRAHLRWWVAVSITAGVSEELLVRGFLVALLTHFTGLAAAVIIAAVLFGIGHAYQELKNAVPTGLYGLALNIVVLISGSLLPAMAIHIMQDFFSGQLAYWALSRAGGGLERQE
ncbi:MAG: CPBP family intramembrane metalloprotease [Candidatus Eremiobacteraeota bacterium]|nr:CPBP family intramembrane metalloprotease [Candidatus Eremiobacteraeota bacterium]MBV9973338.1 CPBP family intramembrane metalloprotease [Candidatus Eremiobacteraeota bacterium]